MRGREDLWGRLRSDARRVGLAGEDLGGTDACGAVGCEYLIDRRGRGRRRKAQHSLDCTRDAEEGDGTFEEGGDGDLVGGVERDAVSLGDRGGLVGEAEAGEAIEVGRG